GRGVRKYRAGPFQQARLARGLDQPRVAQGFAADRLLARRAARDPVLLEVRNDVARHLVLDCADPVIGAEEANGQLQPILCYPPKYAWIDLVDLDAEAPLEALDLVLADLCPRQGML